MPTNNKTTSPGGIQEALICLLDAIVCESLERHAAAFGVGEPAGPALFNRVKAADYLAVSRNTLDRLRETGELKIVEIRGMPRFPKTELDKYICRLQKEG